jgi:predicted membrane-bound mannosyltransferase
MGIFLVFKFFIHLWRVRLSDHEVWAMVHMLLFAPLLIYIGWYKNNVSPSVFSLLLAVGIAAIGYHGLRILQKMYSFGL